MTTMTAAEALKITNELIADRGLYFWKVRFNSAVTIAGVCDYRKKEIVLSRKLMAARDYDRTLDTIRHEVAHALTPGHKHDATWARVHRQLGGNGARCFSGAEVDKTVITTPYEAHCPTDGVIGGYHRQPKTTEGFRCKKCNSAITWTHNGHAFVKPRVAKPRRTTVTAAAVRSWA